ncbi:MAG: hypothetical protein JWP31_411 [Aeromicrobium sp.]|nr:hypothetical protein [Aeromicrobium sp.]
MTSIELGSPSFPLHPGRGIHDPNGSTPPRRAGSVRRTTSIDMTRPLDALGDLHLTGQARDLVTHADGSSTVAATATLAARVDVPDMCRLVELEVTPHDQRWADLIGDTVMAGMRKRADALAPDQRAQRSLAYALVDDLPVTTLISGHAWSVMIGPEGHADQAYLPVADQCAGFISGGTMMTSFDTGVPASPTGPPAPDLGGDDDPLAWHGVGPLPLHGMRRLRRIDVTRDGDVVDVDAMFRDTYVRADGLETVIHEYDLVATVEAATGVVTRSRVRPRVLPWVECPKAVASAERLEGMSLLDLHDRVRRELRGTSTCTHLNDLLRSIGDVRALIGQLA